MAQALAAGTVAPPFRLRATPDQFLSLEDFRGRTVVLAFYPADWSPVCGDELALFNEILPEFQRLGAQLVGISVDGPWSHLAFARDRHLHFPLLADFEPKGATARAYSAYREDDGVCERALYIVDGAGVIRWAYIAPAGMNPGANEVLDALEQLAAGQMAGEAGQVA